jgi:hypothetical protein
MAFFLFILVNAALFIRPAEIVPALLGWEIYFYLILLCLLVATPEVIRYLTGQSLDKQPVTLCVFGVLLLIPLPYVLAGDLPEAWRTGFHFAKVCVYFLLFVSVITTPMRLRTLLGCILGFCAALTLLVVLRYHDIVQLETVRALDDTMQGQYGSTIRFKRLQGTGIFQDPNELCVLLAAMLPLALYFVIASRNLFVRTVSAGLLPLFGYAVFLTGSRGGFLAFASGLAILSWMRLGWQKTVLVGLVGAPMLLFAFGGRQTQISTSEGTAQTRVELWRDWLMTFRENPLVGKGMSLPKEGELENRRSDQELKHLAHNSYLQSFADLGFLGGILFVGAFFTALWALYRYRADQCVVLNPELRALQPYLFASIGAYGVGMMSLSICFVIPTYFMLALSVAYTQMTQRVSLAAPPPLKMDLALLSRMTAAGLGVLMLLYVFVRVVA